MVFMTVFAELKIEKKGQLDKGHLYLIRVAIIY